MSAVNFYGHEDFMREYECKLDVEFELNGHVATWAPNQTGPRLWDEEDERIVLPRGDPVHGIAPASALALTPDDALLAVSMNTIVRLYDMKTLRQCAELAPFPQNVDSLHFQPCALASSPEGGAAYLLVSQCTSSTEGATIFIHRLSEQGTPIEDERRGPCKLVAGLSPSFGSQVWNSTGRRIAYIAHPETTQHSTRPADQLPQVIILDFVTEQGICRLSGHTDAIMWVSWSPDDRVMATASWDRTYGIWDAQTGIRKHVIGPTRGQNWAGAFINDGRHLLLSGAPMPQKVSILDVETADLVASLQPTEGITLDRTLRYFAAHPSRDLIVFQNGRTLLAWTPFESSDQPPVQVLLALHPDGDPIKNSYGSIQNIKWIDRGRKLVAQGEDQTIFVWDITKQWKWRFQRPHGRAAGDGNGTDVLSVTTNGDGTEWLLSMGEGVLRIWKL